MLKNQNKILVSDYQDGSTDKVAHPQAWETEIDPHHLHRKPEGWLLNPRIWEAEIGKSPGLFGQPA